VYKAQGRAGGLPDLLVRYVHLNPVRGHLVEAPQQWRWSSLNDYLHSSQYFFYSASQMAQFLQISPSAITRLQSRFHKRIITNPGQEAYLFQMFMQK
jgi:hypothetical protein